MVKSAKPLDQIEANDHLLKAVIALLTIKDPTFIAQLDEVFLVARCQQNKVGRMDPGAWAAIREELSVVRQFVIGDDEPEVKVGHRTTHAPAISQPNS